MGPVLEFKALMMENLSENIFSMGASQDLPMEPQLCALIAEGHS